MDTCFSIDKDTMWASVDPGRNGAIVLWRGETITEIFLLEELLGAKKERKRLRLEISPEFAVIEDVHGITGDSASGSFNFGWSAGILHQFFNETAYVAPQKWQYAMHKGLPKSMDTKLRSRAIVERLHPRVLEAYPFKKHDGVWDAVCLGRYFIASQIMKNVLFGKPTATKGKS